jgi:predicted MFS family arabinose efflux permease
MLVAFLAAGLFLSTAAPAGGKLVFTTVRAGRRSLAMGIRQAAVPLGGLGAAAVLPLVASWMGWRAALLLAGVVCAAGGLTLVALAGLGPRVESEPVRARLALHGLAGRAFVLTTLWAALFVGSQYAVLTFLAVDAKSRAGVSAATAASLLIVVQATGMAARVGWGVAADRMPHLRARALPATVTALGIGAAALLALLPLQTLGGFAALAVLCGISINGWQGLWAVRLTEIAGVARAGTAMGVALTFIGIAITAAPPAYGAIADATGTMRALWGALACALVVALVAVLLLPPLKEEDV